MTKEEQLLYDFFLWFRENGELHMDKSIESMIKVYAESNLVLVEPDKNSTSRFEPFFVLKSNKLHQY